MRYKVQDYEIKTENAAKPATQASQQVVSWLVQHSPFRHSLDYGCGKLRYAEVLKEVSAKLTVVDSREQLEREQNLLGTRTTIRELIGKWPGCRALTPEDLREDSRKYDFALCANVLSAIPSYSIRASVIQTISEKLSPDGASLFTTQYRNSYFVDVQKRRGTERYLDGWIINGTRGRAFYGIIKPDRLKTLIERGGMTVKDQWSWDGSTYVLAIPAR